MKTVRSLSHFGVVMLVLILGTHGAAAEVHPILKGLQGVDIFIETPQIKPEGTAWTKAQLETGVKQKLHQAGIRILTENETSGVLGLPVLHVRLDVTEHPSGLYAYQIDVSLREIVRPERDNLIFTDAATWSDGILGIRHRSELKDIQQILDTYVARFIDAYRATNHQPSHQVNVNATEPAVPSAPTSQPDRIRQAQIRLQAMGLNPGPRDGQLGPRTQQALTRYQAQQHLPQTGQLDPPTRQALDLH